MTETEIIFDLERRLTQLTHRVWQLERHAGIVPPPVQTPQQPPPVVAPPPIVGALAAPPMPPTPSGSASTSPPPTLSDWTPRSGESWRNAAALTHAPAVAPATPPAPLHPPAAKPPLSIRFPIEHLVGGKLYAGIGAVVLIIGVILGLKLGIDRGWFIFSPALRCLTTAISGIALVGAGRFIRLRWGRLAGVGLSSAGVGIVFASVFASYAWYQLVSAPVALGLSVAAGVFGVLVALGAQSLAVGVIALLCSYLTPFILSDSSVDRPWIVPMHASVLLIVSLALAAWRPLIFRGMRTVAAWGTIVLGTAWFIGSGYESPLAAWAFFGFAWIAIHAELVFGARRLAEAAPTVGRGTYHELRVAAPLLASLGMTIWSCGLTITGLEITPVAAPSWMAAGAWCVASLVLGLMLAGSLRVMRDQPETDGERLGVDLLAQAGALTIATLALSLSGWTLTAAWLAMGVGAMCAGRWARMRLVELFGFAVLVLATSRIFIWDSWNAGGMPVNVMGLMLSRYSLLAAIGGVGWLTAACTFARGRELSPARKFVSIFALVAGAVCFAGTLLVRGADHYAVLIGWSVIALGYIAASRFDKRLPLHLIGVGVLVLTSALALMMTVDGRMWLGRAGGAFSNPWFFMGLWFVVIGAVAPALVGTGVDGKPRAAFRLCMGAFVLVAFYLFSSFEITRSAEILVPESRTIHRAALTVWSALFAVGLIVFGFARKMPAVRHVGLGLLGLAVAKALLFDMVDIEAEWRVLSFIVLGLMMLGVAVGYARVSTKLAGPEHSPEAGKPA